MKNSIQFYCRIFAWGFLIFLAPKVYSLDSAGDKVLSEKVDSSELLSFYTEDDDTYIEDSFISIDEKELEMILKYFDEEDLLRQQEFLKRKQQKVIKEAGGIKVPDNQYAQDMIHKYIARYMTNFGRQNLYNILDRGEAYRLYVRQEIKKRGLPPALEYLPVVESEYKPNAKSRSGARGMWQFMENSIAPFMTKDEWIDERLDPWKSTQAALSKLEDNYRMFGDWAIALAAYNCGAGAMRRILNKSPVKTFWYIAEQGLLYDESVNYIPKLIAITELAEHGEEYKIELPEVSSLSLYDDFDYITVDYPLSLTYLAGQLRLDYESLKSLNNSLIKDCTPPKKYRLRLPAGLADSAKDVLGM